MIKKLLELNLYELNKSLNLNLSIEFKNNKFYIIENSEICFIDGKIIYEKDLSVEFKDNKFYVIENSEILLIDGKIIYEKDLSEVKLDFNSQKNLMLDILNKIGSIFKKSIIQIDGKNYLDILGEGIAYKYQYVRINITNDYFQFKLALINFVIDYIRKNLDGNKVRVVYNEGYDCAIFNVSKIIKESKLTIYFLDNGINSNEINLCYTLSNDDDIDNAVRDIVMKVNDFYFEYLNYLKIKKGG